MWLLVGALRGWGLLMYWCCSILCFNLPLMAFPGRSAYLFAVWRSLWGDSMDFPALMASTRGLVSWSVYGIDLTLSDDC